MKPTSEVGKTTSNGVGFYAFKPPKFLNFFLLKCLFTRHISESADAQVRSARGEKELDNTSVSPFIY